MNIADGRAGSLLLLRPDQRLASALEVLRSVQWLANARSGTLDTLSQRALIHRLPAGSVIFEQGEQAAFAAILICGQIAMLGVRGETEVLVEMLAPPDMLLPAAVINRQSYLLRARALDEAHLLLIEAETFRTALADDHGLCLAMLAVQAAQFRRQVKQEKNVLLRSAEERVGAYLLNLTENSAQTKVRLPLEKRMIASQLGMTRETLSRALSAVSKSGIIVQGDLVTITDRAAARARFPLDPLIDGAEPVRPATPVTDPQHPEPPNPSTARRRK